MSRRVSMALIGAGGIGHAYADASRLVDEVDLTVIADVRAAGAVELAEACGAEYVSDPLTLLDPQRIGLALLCTPPATHQDLAVTFLESGVPVMCEKPLATTRAAGQRILAAASATGTPLTMASKFRFVSDVIEARSIVQSGVLGDIVGIEVAFCAPVDMRDRWNSQPAISGGGVLMDNGTHGMDILRYILGPVVQVLATLTTSTPGMAVEDTAVVLARTSEGHLGNITVSWSTDRLTERYLAVMGTEGSLEVGWRGSRLRLRSNSSDVPFGRGYNKVEALADNLRNTALALLGVEEFRVTTLDAMASVLAVEAAYESVRTGTWTCVPARSHDRMVG